MRHVYGEECASTAIDIDVDCKNSAVTRTRGCDSARVPSMQANSHPSVFGRARCGYEAMTPVEINVIRCCTGLAKTDNIPRYL